MEQPGIVGQMISSAISPPLVEVVPLAPPPPHPLLMPVSPGGATETGARGTNPYQYMKPCTFSQIKNVCVFECLIFHSYQTEKVCVFECLIFHSYQMEKVCV